MNVQLLCPVPPGTLSSFVPQTASDERSFRKQTSDAHNLPMYYIHMYMYYNHELLSQRVSHATHTCIFTPVVADGVLLLPDVHELCGDTALLLALPHQSLHQLLLATLLLPHRDTQHYILA